jgi:hypothetical protein
VSEPNIHFIQLLWSLQTGAMIQLGKMASPVSGAIERNLEQARATIDLLEALKLKTDGNLSTEEKSLLDRALYELRLNYVDESSKESASTPTSTVNSQKPATDNDTTTD